MDKWTVLNSLIITIPPTLVALAGVIVSIRNTQKINTAQDKINTTHNLINSRFDQWMEMAKRAYFAEGVKAEKDRAESLPISSLPTLPGSA